MFFLIVTENCTILKYVCLNVHCLQKFVKLSLVHERVTFTCMYTYVCVCLCVLCLDLCIVTVIQIYSVLSVQFASSGKTTECISNGAWCKSRPRHLLWDFSWFFSQSNQLNSGKMSSISATPASVYMLQRSYFPAVLRFNTISSDKLATYVESRLTIKWLSIKIIWWFGSVS